MKKYIIPNTAVILLGASLMETQTGSVHEEKSIKIGGKTSDKTGTLDPY